MRRSVEEYKRGLAKGGSAPLVSIQRLSPTLTTPADSEPATTTTSESSVTKEHAAEAQGQGEEKPESPTQKVDLMKEANSDEKAIKGEDQPKATSTSSFEDKLEVRKDDASAAEGKEQARRSTTEELYGFEYPYLPPGYYPPGLPLPPPKILPLPGQQPGYFRKIFVFCL